MNVQVGVRITDQGITFFGTDQVNELLARGRSVVRIDPGEVLVEEVESDEPGGEAFSLAGFQLSVTIREP